MDGGVKTQFESMLAFSPDTVNHDVPVADADGGAGAPWQD